MKIEFISIDALTLIELEAYFTFLGGDCHYLLIQAY